MNAILQAQGTLETYEQGVVLDKAFENFINSKYVLYGRKVKIIPYQGKCQSVPPDKKCLIPEMDNIVASYNPFIVMWNTTLCSECFAETRAQQDRSPSAASASATSSPSRNEPYYYSRGRELDEDPASLRRVLVQADVEQVEPIAQGEVRVAQRTRRRTSTASHACWA